MKLRCTNNQCSSFNQDDKQRFSLKCKVEIDIVGRLDHTQIVPKKLMDQAALALKNGELICCNCNQPIDPKIDTGTKVIAKNKLEEKAVAVAKELGLA